jgi:hypothetical protein
MNRWRLRRRFPARRREWAPTLRPGQAMVCHVRKLAPVRCKRVWMPLRLCLMDRAACARRSA